MIRNLLFFLFLLSASISFSQEWATKMQDPNGNFYDVKASFDSYWATRDNTEKGKGYKAFKRWANFVEKRVYPSGDLSLLGQTAKNFEAFVNTQKSATGKTIGSGNNLTASATFTPMGPMGAISGSAGGQFLKSGRLNFLTIDPTNTLNLWAGAPAGGLWSSTNGGTTWSTATDNLSVIGCSDLAIDPSNTSIMYLATGDGDAGDTRSIGVLKTTNGGVTWSATGLTNTVNNYFLIRRLIISPSNSQVLLAATNSGIYRTTNGGTTWAQVTTSSTYDLEFKPGNPAIVYASGSTFRMSTNGGASFTQISAGIATTGVNRMAIAVTPDDANYVYVLASNASNSGFYGFYKSVNSGTTFTQITTTLNLLGYSNAGTDTGGQGWYDLCIAASPLNKDEVVTGGVNVWRTTNGGTSWSIYSHWVGSGAPFSHADHHDLEYNSSGVLYGVNDGTVYKRASGSWTEVSGSMNISQIYRLGMSSLTANKWITGHQDNGTAIYNGTNYVAAMGGDGMDCFINRTNDNTMFAEYYNGTLNRSTNGGTSWSSITTGLTGNAPWVTAWKQDPQTANTLYCGYDNLFKSVNLGTNWTQLTAIGGTGSVIEFAIAPSNNQVIYVLKSSGIYKTVNGGTTWTNVTGTVPVASASPQYITIDPTDPTNAWVVLSGYSTGNKIYMTANGGTTWTNYSANLPNLPANCCLYQPGTTDLIYVGMDVGIYYRSSSQSTWTLYNAGLPNVPISELEISPATPNLLHAATYGRGVWVASTISGISLPVSNFSMPQTNRCSGSILTFTDQSFNSPTTWSWTVLPTTGVSISSTAVPSPSIIFPAGIFTVSLVSANANGTSSVFSQTIGITAAPIVNIAGSTQTVCGGAPATFTASGAATYTWSNGGGNAPMATFFPQALTVYTLTASGNGCTITRTATATPGASPTITISGPDSMCEGETIDLTAGGANSYTWTNIATGAQISVSPSVTSTYSVLGQNSSGCVGGTMILVTVNPLPVISVFATDTTICENEDAVMYATGAANYTWMPGAMNGSPVNYLPSGPTTFTVFGTDMNGCSSTSLFNVMVDVCAGITAFDKTSGYLVFPSPAHDKITIGRKVHSTINLQAMITDVLGKTVIQSGIVLSPVSNNRSIDLTGLSSGTYFLRITSGEEEPFVVRIIKQ